MVREFDPFATVDQLIEGHRKTNGSRPTTVSISPNAYRWLVEFKAQVHAIGNLVVCCSPLHEFMASDGSRLRIIIILIFLFPYIVAFAPNSNDTSSTSIEFGVGYGSYAEVARDCSGRVTNIQHVPFTEISGGVSHQIADFKFGISSGYMSDWRDNLFTNNPLARKEDGLFYVTPKLGVDTKYFGLEAGYLIPLNLASEFNSPGMIRSKRKGLPTGMLRLGSRDSWYFSTSFANNTPLATGGGLFDLGLGFTGNKAHSLFWIGLGVGPYDGAALSLKGNLPVSSNFILNVRAQVAGNETFEYGISMGGKVIF